MYDMKMKDVVIKEGDLILVYDSRYKAFPGKLHTRWGGPFKVHTINPNGSLILMTTEGEFLLTGINGSRCKKYTPPSIETLSKL